MSACATVSETVHICVIVFAKLIADANVYARPFSRCRWSGAAAYEWHLAVPQPRHVLLQWSSPAVPQLMCNGLPRAIAGQGPSCDLVSGALYPGGAEDDRFKGVPRKRKQSVLYRCPAEATDCLPCHHSLVQDVSISQLEEDRWHTPSLDELPPRPLPPRCAG